MSHQWSQTSDLPLQSEGAVTHSRIRARAGVAGLTLSKLKTDFSSSQRDIFESPRLSGTLEAQLQWTDTWVRDQMTTPSNPSPVQRQYPKIDILLLLLMAKLRIEQARGSPKVYEQGQRLARAALDIAVNCQDEFSVYRAYFYIGETEAVRCKKSFRHYELASRCYKKAQLAASQYPYEGNRAVRRLEELDHFFPRSSVSAANSPYPWSAIASDNGALTPDHIRMAIAWTSAIERTNKKKKNVYERVPSFDSWHDEDEVDRLHGGIAGHGSTSHETSSLWNERDTSPVVATAHNDQPVSGARKRSVAFASPIAGDGPTRMFPSAIARKILTRKLTSPSDQTLDRCQIKDDLTPNSDG